MSTLLTDMPEKFNSFRIHQRQECEKKKITSGFENIALDDLTDGEVALAGDRRQFVVMTGFEHSLPPAVSVFARDGR